MAKPIVLEVLNPPTPAQAAEMCRRVAPLLASIYRDWERQQAEEAHNDEEGDHAAVRTA